MQASGSIKCAFFCLDREIPLLYSCRSLGAAMAKPAKRGRPKGSVAQKTRDTLVQFKVFEDERAAYEEAARRDGLTLSAWVRMHLNRIVRGASRE